MSAYRLMGDAFSEYFFDRVLFDDPKLAPYFRVDREELRTAQRLVRDARKTLVLRANAASTESQLLRPLGSLLGWVISEETTPVETVHGEADGGLTLTDPDGGVWARAFCAAPNANLDATPQGLHRRFSLATNIARVLDATSTPYAIALNREELRVVRRAEGGANSAVSFSLDALEAWHDSSERGWRLLFALLRSASLVEPRVLDRVVEQGRREMVGVGNALGLQVQEALAIFVRGLYAQPGNVERLPQSGDELGLAVLFGESLRILYRCLFALFAEARGLVPVDLPIYRESYALMSASEAPTNGASARLRALFRLLWRGADLGNGEKVPAFGGALFSIDAAPLVESLSWDDASVAKMLTRLTRIEGRRGRGQMPVSYRELDEERLGTIYEGLLELRLSLADKPMQRIVVQGRELVIDPVLLHGLAGYETDCAPGSAVGNKSSETAEGPEIADPDEIGAEDDSQVDDIDSMALNGDVALEPVLTNGDGRDGARRRVVTHLETIEPGTPYLASSSGRKETASYYTARDLVDFLVRETIDPRAERAEPADILRLRVVDPAMGSGHFLIGAMRRLADHLMAAYRRVVEPEEMPGPSSAALETLPLLVQRAWDDERELLALCRQLVAVHCLYGVDKNPLAVDLARVALWLATAAADHPLSFLDHRLRCGDSLLGLTVAQVVAIPTAASGKSRGKSKTKQYSLLTIDGEVVDEIALERAVQRSLLVAFNVLRGFLAIVDDDTEPFELKRERADAVRLALEPLLTLHAARVGQLLHGLENGGSDSLLRTLQTFSNLGYLEPSDRTAIENFVARATQDNAFCWELEFPEAFYRSRDDGEVVRRDDAGFDVVIGNPPWDKLRIDERQYYARYDPLMFLFEGRNAKVRIKHVNLLLENSKAAFEEAKIRQARYALTLASLPLYKNQTLGVHGERLRTHHDLYKFFAELDWSLISADGRVGLVLPGAFSASAGASGLRRMILEEARIQTLIVFENRKKLFAIDSRFKFEILVFSRPGPTQYFRAAYWQHRTEVLKNATNSALLDISASELRSLDPANLVFTEFHDERDVSIVRHLARTATPLGAVDSQWPARFGSDIGLSTKSHAFRSRYELANLGATRVGNEFLGTNGEIFIPVYEGRMIQNFDENAKGWVSGDGRASLWAEHGYPKDLLEPHHWIDTKDVPGNIALNTNRFYWCEVTGATNERSAMGTVTKVKAVAGNSLVRLDFPDGCMEHLAIASCVFNSFVFDWFVRLRISDHLSYSYVAAAPFAKSVDYKNLREAVSLVSSGTVGYLERADLRADLDAAVALAYQITYEDFGHILAAFPLLDRGEPPLAGESKSTITRDLALSAFCRLASEHDPEHADRVRAARNIGALGYVATPLRLQLPNAIRRPR